MEKRRKDSLLKKLLLRLELETGTLGIKPFCIGNEAESLFLDDFDAPEYLKTLGVTHHRSDIYNTNTLMILGALNLNQTHFIQAFLEKYPKHFELIVHIKGALTASQLTQIDFSQIETEPIPVDITYDKYPVVPKEIFSLIKNFQLARLV